MTRLLTVVFIALLGFVVYVELTKKRDVSIAAEKTDTIGSQPPESHPPTLAEKLTPEKRIVPDLTALPASSLSDGLFEKGQWRGKPVLVDLNGDGNLDLVASIRRWDRSTPGEGIFVWLGDGRGGWKAMNEGLRRDMGYGGSAIADVDGNGTLDIAFSGHAGSPSVFLNFLNHPTQKTWVPIADGIEVTAICGDVGLGDFDGDGKTDLVALGQFPKNSGLFVFRGDGTGSFKLATNLMEKTNYGAQVHLVDLDGDARDEVIAVTDAGPKVWRFTADKWVDQSKGFEKPQIGGTDMAIVAADLIGDKHKELVRAGIEWEGHPSLQAFRWTGEQWESFGRGLPSVESYYDLALANLNGTTVIVAAANSGIHVVMMTSPGEFELVGRLENTSGTLNVCAGDIDGDGVDEIVYAGFNGIRVLKLTGDWYKAR